MFRLALFMVLGTLIVGALYLLLTRRSGSNAESTPNQTNRPPTAAIAAANSHIISTNAAVAPNPPASNRSSDTNRVAMSKDFQVRPFPVAYQSGNYQWTAEDGLNTNVIRKLAHNQLEYRRMLVENKAIFQRQLVYFTQGFAPLAQQAVQTKKSLKQITLPGLDGQTFSVDVTRTDFRNGGSKGQIYGQLPGEPNSMVTVAFVNDREAFTIISPQDHIYLQAEAREPGQVVIKRINPALYGAPWALSN